MKSPGMILSTVKFNLIVLTFLFLCMNAFPEKLFAEIPNHEAQPKFGDTITIERKFSNKKHTVKLYPDANHQVLFFSARGEENKSYQLYLFDINGQLIKQVNIKSKHTTLLKNIKKGSYQFEVFSNDERIEAGNVSVT